MKTINHTYFIALIIIASFSLSAVGVFAHGIERKPETTVEGNYIVAFRIEPQFPVTRKTTHLDIIVEDSQANKKLSNLQIALELHTQDSSKVIILEKGTEEEAGHYGFSYTFLEKGLWEIHVSINGQELEKEFTVDVDNFGLSGLLRSGIIVFLALILIVAARRDCARAVEKVEASNV